MIGNTTTYILVALLMFANNISACSSIWLALSGYYLLGANLDYERNLDGLIFINYRNTEKKTDMYNDGATDLEWISKYGSVSFNLVCKEYAQYGMNEKGLIISTVSDPNTKGPIKDNRPSMFGNFWIQYLLDMCETTEEVKQTLEFIRVMPGNDRYVICDKSMHAMIIEFHDHKVKIFEGETLPFNVLTNQSYQNCLSAYSENKLPTANDVFNYVTTKRFFDAANSLKQSDIRNKDEGKSWLFKNLKIIQGSTESIWRIVFDQSEMKVIFITKSNKQKRYLDLNKIDFSCGEEKYMLNIDEKYSGDISHLFIPYTNEANFNLYQSAVYNLSKSISADEIKTHINFLEDFRCN